MNKVAHFLLLGVRRFPWPLVTVRYGPFVDTQSGGLMSATRLVLLVLALLSISYFTSARQAPSTDPQATALLQKSLFALSGGQTLTDVTLSGTVRRIAGSDDETGTATYKAISGANRLDLTLSGG